MGNLIPISDPAVIFTQLLQDATQLTQNVICKFKAFTHVYDKPQYYMKTRTLDGNKPQTKH